MGWRTVPQLKPLPVSLQRASTCGDTASARSAPDGAVVRFYRRYCALYHSTVRRNPSAKSTTTR